MPTIKVDSSTKLDQCANGATILVGGGGTVLVELPDNPLGFDATVVCQNDLARITTNPNSSLLVNGVDASRIAPAYPGAAIRIVGRSENAFSSIVAPGVFSVED